MIWIVLCSIYAGPDPGINPNYRAAYYAETFDSEKNVEQYLLAHHSESCSVYEGKRIEFDLQMVKVQKEETQVTGVKLKP